MSVNVSLSHCHQNDSLPARPAIQRLSRPISVRVLRVVPSLALRACGRQPPSARARSSIPVPCCGSRRRSWKPSFKARSALADSSTLESLLEVCQTIYKGLPVQCPCGLAALNRFWSTLAPDDLEREVIALVFHNHCISLQKIQCQELPQSPAKPARAKPMPNDASLLQKLLQPPRRPHRMPLPLTAAYPFSHIQ